MTLLWIDGFEGQDADLLYEGKLGTLSYSTATRFGYGQALDVRGSNPYYVQKAITASADVYAGAAFFATNTAGSTSNPQRDLFMFYGDSGATLHIAVSINTSLGIDIKRGSTVVASSAAGVLTALTWFYLEVHGKVADTGGFVNVRLNGGTTDVVSFSGDTKNAGTSTNIDAVRMSGGSSLTNQITLLDDLYICNGLGTVNNGFLGDRRVQTLFPSGAGSTTGLTPTGSATNWQNVDEAPPSATDYNSSPTTGTRDTYAMTDLEAGTSTVLGVRNCVAAHKSDAGAIGLKTATKSGATLSYGSTLTLGTAMTEFSEIQETNPATSAAWSASEVNAVEFGAEVV